jgi:cation/acetate symporter
VINGTPAAGANQLIPVGNMSEIAGVSGPEADTGSVGPFEYLALISAKDTTIQRWSKTSFTENGESVTVYYPTATSGNQFMRPGLKFKVEGSSILTLYLELGAMANGVINPADGNMSAPLLAKSFGIFLFAIISAIAFATVLGIVSGLIVAASGAVAHDVMDMFMQIQMTEQQKVMAGKITAVVVGIIAIFLGIIFEGMNVSFLVGWAFAVAASANLPSIIMVLFWEKTTLQGIVSSIFAGTVVAAD